LTRLRDQHESENPHPVCRSGLQTTIPTR